MEVKYIKGQVNLVERKGDWGLFSSKGYMNELCKENDGEWTDILTVESETLDGAMEEYKDFISYFGEDVG